MNIEGARRVLETTSAETANQYLRFGWKLINQHLIEATANEPSAVRFVLASMRSLEDTRQVLTLRNEDEVNLHLTLGWKLIDKYVTAAHDSDRRDETMCFVLAWQSEEEPVYPGALGNPRVQAAVELIPDDLELDR